MKTKQTTNFSQCVFTILILTATTLVLQGATLAQDYTKMGLPDGAIGRLGKGEIGGRDRGVAFSPNGKILAVATSIGIWLYDAQTYQEIDLLAGHTSHVNAVAFSPDGKLLASASDDTTVKLWDVSRRQKVATFAGHTFGVTAVAFSPDGKLLASASGDGTVLLWKFSPEPRPVTTYLAAMLIIVLLLLVFGLFKVRRSRKHKQKQEQDDRFCNEGE
ncbi:hypothetical protein HYR99_33045 [Candidatus Poribacteria bacterium]|nr:hypothetical protein [Candidatus Poribacteria bacterium]